MPSLHCSLHTLFPNKFLYLSCTFCVSVVRYSVMLIDISIALISHSLTIRFFIQHRLQMAHSLLIAAVYFAIEMYQHTISLRLRALRAVSGVVKNHLHLYPPAS